MGHYIELFAGIGGLSLAVEEWFGFTPAAFCEIDPACQRVLARHWPGVPIIGDVRSVGRAAVVSDISLVCGGFPCQPASLAGKRKGTADDRWLWPEFARVVGEFRPKFVVVENVAGLLTVSDGTGFGEVISDLASLGYDARWGVVRASDVGAPHRRERLFLLAHPTGSVVADSDCSRSQGGSRGDLASRKDQVAPHGGVDSCSFDWGDYRPALRRWERLMGFPTPHPVDAQNRLSADFVEHLMGFPPGWSAGESRITRLKQLGNAVVRQQAVRALSLLSSQVEGR